MDMAASQAAGLYGELDGRVVVAEAPARFPTPCGCSIIGGSVRMTMYMYYIQQSEESRADSYD